MASSGDSARVVPMRLIVCSVMRTGTLSMRNALWQLGLHDCHHMQTLINDPSRTPEWVRVFEAKYAGKGSFGREDWDRLLGDCQAVCDLPSGAVAVEIAQAYPEAKVIILSRDAEEWYESVLHSNYPNMRPKKLVVILQMLFCLIFDEKTRYMAKLRQAFQAHVLVYDHGKEKEKALGWYEKQYAEYREKIPSERYIEYNIKDGWEPLCTHLGLPVPMLKDEATGEMIEAPFPHLNDRQTFVNDAAERRSRSIARATDNLLKLVGKAAVTGAIAYGGYLLWRSRLSGRF